MILIVCTRTRLLRARD